MSGHGLWCYLSTGTVGSSFPVRCKPSVQSHFGFFRGLCRMVCVWLEPGVCVCGAMCTARETSDDSVCIHTSPCRLGTPPSTAPAPTRRRPCDSALRSELRNVSLILRNVSLILRNVSFILRNVGSQTQHASAVPTSLSSATQLPLSSATHPPLFSRQAGRQAQPTATHTTDFSAPRPPLPPTRCSVHPPWCSPALGAMRTSSIDDIRVCD